MPCNPLQSIAVEIKSAVLNALQLDVTSYCIKSKTLLGLEKKKLKCIKKNQHISSFIAFDYF